MTVLIPSSRNEVTSGMASPACTIATSGQKARALAGVIIGSIAALVASKLMTSLLYGVTGASLVTCAIAGAALVLVALVASYIPARRATGLDPIVALRAE